MKHSHTLHTEWILTALASCSTVNTVLWGEDTQERAEVKILILDRANAQIWRTTHLPWLGRGAAAEGAAAGTRSDSRGIPSPLHPRDFPQQPPPHGNSGIPWNIRKLHKFIWVFITWMNYYCVRDSTVGIALGYGRDDRGSRVRFPAGTGNSLYHRVQDGSGAHLVSYPVGTRGSFPEGKAAGAWIWTHLHLVPISKYELSYTSTLPIRLHGVVLS
jgi:hypothetical protein